MEDRNNIQVIYEIIRLVSAIEKTLEGNNLMNQLKQLMKGNKNLDGDDESGSSSDDLENRILTNQAAFSNSRPMLDQMHQYEEKEKIKIINFLNKFDKLRAKMTFS